MDGAQARQEAGDELIRRAARRLEGAWQDAVTVGDVLVAMPDHSVFRTLAPGSRPVIVKADLWQQRAAAEQRVTAAAHAAGLPVPEVVYADGGVPALLVLQHVPGPVLTADAPQAAWIDAGRTLRRVHDLTDPGGLPSTTDWRAHGRAAARPATAASPATVAGPVTAASPATVAGPVPAARRPLRDALPEIAARDAAAGAQRGMLTGREAARLSDLLGGIFGAAAEPDRYCVLHGDPQPGHFLLDDRPGTSMASIAALIDFGEACTGDPAWDLTILTLDNPERLGDVLAGYQPGAYLTERLRRMIGSYRALRWLGEAHWLQEHGFSPDEPLAALRQVIAGDQPDTLGNG